MPSVKVYKDSYLELKLDGARGILSASWPDITEANKSSIESSLRYLHFYLQEHHIKYLLIDVRKSKITISAEAYSRLLAWFNLKLLETDLIKIARIKSAEPEREKKLLKNSIHAFERDFPIVLQDFNTHREACSWLRLPS